jgi:hypothetical protein
VRPIYYCQAERSPNGIVSIYSLEGDAKMARIYLASSWRNPYQPELVQKLRDDGHAVYDFREDTRTGDRPLGPGAPGATAFAWAEMDPAWQDWTPENYLKQLQASPRAAQGYIGDLRGMEWADTCVLCLPAGNSAHIEAGYMKGEGKRLIIYWHNNDKVTSSGPQEYLKTGEQAPTKTWTFEPDLMYLLADNLCLGYGQLAYTLIDGSVDK